MIKKIDNCIVLAVVVICLYISFLCYGFFLLGWYEENVRPYESKINRFEIRLYEVEKKIKNIKITFNKSLNKHEKSIHYGRKSHNN